MNIKSDPDIHTLSAADAKGETYKSCTKPVHDWPPMFACECFCANAFIPIQPRPAYPPDSSVHFSVWLSAQAFSDCFLQVVQYLCRYKSSCGRSFAQECLNVLISLL